MYNTKDVYLLSGLPCDYCLYVCIISCTCSLPVCFLMYHIADNMILRGEY